MGEETVHLRIMDGKIFEEGNPEPLGDLRDLIAEMHRPLGLTLTGKGSYHTRGVPLDPETGQSHVVDLYLFATQVAEVEVDPVTGLVRVLNIWAAHDVGKAIHPLNVEGQIEGGVHMGLGFALTEEIVRERGKTLNPLSLITSCSPPWTCRRSSRLQWKSRTSGPFGARGIGEATTIPTAAAIANAVFNAVGVKMQELPMTPEKVLRAIKEKGKEGRN